MENKGQLSSQDLKIQGLIDRYLHSQVAGNGLKIEQQHLDEDSLTAFVEGNLSDRESQPVVNHLVKCSYCRHITTELIRLDLAFADDAQVFTKPDEQPSKISEVLGGLLSRIFGGNDEAVFAHQDPEETKTEEKKEE